FSFQASATPGLYTLSLHDALPISETTLDLVNRCGPAAGLVPVRGGRLQCGEVIRFQPSRQDVRVVDPGAEARELLERSAPMGARSEEHTSELQSRENLVCRLLLEK